MNVDILQRMSDLKVRSRDVLVNMQKYGAEMLTLSVEYVQDRLNTQFAGVPVVTRVLVTTLDCHDTPVSNDRVLEALKSRWPDLKVSEIVFDKQSNKFLIFTT